MLKLNMLFLKIINLNPWVFFAKKRKQSNLVLCKEREEVVGDWAWFIDEPKAGRGLPLVGFHSHAHVEIEKRRKVRPGLSNFLLLR